MLDQNPTYPDIFVKIHGSTQLAEDRLALDIEVLAANAGGLVPHQPVEITLNNKTQRLTTDATGRARLELVFPVRSGERQKLLARAPGSQKEITKIDIVPDGFGRAIVAGVKANYEKEIEKLRAEIEGWKGKSEGGQETKTPGGSSLSEADTAEVLSGKRPVKKGETISLQKDSHVVEGDIQVEIGGRLSIEAGSQLLFKEKAGILCEGTLTAVETGERQIIFTAKDASWLNITLKNRTAAGSRMEHCFIEKGSGRKIDDAHVRIQA